MVEKEQPAKPPAPGSKTASKDTAQPDAPAQLKIALFPEFFDADPMEQGRIIIHEAFHHAKKQGNPNEIYELKCGEPKVDVALTNAQSYAMFAAHLAHSGLLVGFEDCPDAWKLEMVAASRTAEIWVSNAVAKLDAVLANPKNADKLMRTNLKRHFKTEPSAAEVLKEIRGPLGEIQAAFSGELPLECETECKPDTPGYTGGLLFVFPRGGNIHLCPYWFDPKLDHYERAETILHEMAHRYAGMGFNEVYFKDPKTVHQYYAQSTEDALSNADSYAQFARMVGGGIPASTPPAESEKEEQP